MYRLKFCENGNFTEQKTSEKCANFLLKAHWNSIRRPTDGIWESKHPSSVVSSNIKSHLQCGQSWQKTPCWLLQFPRTEDLTTSKTISKLVYSSRSLDDAERAWDTTHKESLAVVPFVLSIRLYLESAQFKNQIGYDALRRISTAGDASGKLSGCCLHLLESKLDIMHRKCNNTKFQMPFCHSQPKGKTQQSHKMH